MTYGAGIGAQLGIATESAYGDGITTVDHFYEFNSESLTYRKNTVEGLGLRAGGSVARSQRRVVTTQDVGGDIELDLTTNGLGLLLAHATGTFPTPTTVTTGVYSYVFTLADTFGHSFATEVSVPAYDGTTYIKKLNGCKIPSFELGVSNAGIATGRFTVDGGYMNTFGPGTPTEASYSTSVGLFHFANGFMSVDGADVYNVRDFTLTVDNTLKTDRYSLTNGAIKNEPLHDGFRKISGSMTLEFTDNDLLFSFMDDSERAVELIFNAGSNAQLRIEVSAIKLDGDLPQVGGPGLIEVPVTFTGYDNGTDEPLTITYITTDSAL